MKFYIREPLQFKGIRFRPFDSENTSSDEVQSLCSFSRSKAYSVNLQRNGMYYRVAKYPPSPRNLRCKKHAHNTNPSSFNHERPLFVHNTETKSSVKLTESSPHEFLKELNRKLKYIYLWPFALLLALIPKFGVFISIAILPVLFFLVDKPRKTTFLYYHISPEVEEEIQQFYRVFNDLKTCKSAWHISSEEKVDVVKYQAGASWLVKRARLEILYKSPPMLKTNILVPCLSSSKCKYYFLPDRVLVHKHSTISSIRYANIKITQRNTKFIEDQPIPSDSKNVGWTWRFVNIDGSRDKRFKYNHKLPILLYSELHIKSTSNAKEVIQLSKPDAGLQLQESMKSYSLNSFLIEKASKD